MDANRFAKSRVVVTKDKQGHCFTVPVEPPEYDKNAETVPVNVWWDRDPPKRKRIKAGTYRTTQEEWLVIRQENHPDVEADVIMLTLGQAYDLLSAITQAIENT